METLSSKNYFPFFVMFCIIFSQISPNVAIQRTNTNNNPPTYTNFLRSSCKATLYPDLCYNSLSTYSNAIQTNPKMLASAALSVTLTTTKTTTAMFSKMSKGAGIRPREGGALRDCLEELNDSISELQESIKEMSQMKDGKKMGVIMNDIQTWVSAALTDENTCMDGFDGKIMDGKLKNVVRRKIVNICHLTSNSLALINSYASLINN